MFQLVDDLGVGKSKADPVDLRKLNDLVDNEVVKNTKINILKTKVNKLDKKTPNFYINGLVTATVPNGQI